MAHITPYFLYNCAPCVTLDNCAILLILDSIIDTLECKMTATRALLLALLLCNARVFCSKELRTEAKELDKDRREIAHDQCMECSTLYALGMFNFQRLIISKSIRLRFNSLPLGNVQLSIRPGNDAVESLVLRCSVQSKYRQNYGFG